MHVKKVPRQRWRRQRRRQRREKGKLLKQQNEKDSREIEKKERFNGGVLSTFVVVAVIIGLTKKSLSTHFNNFFSASFSLCL